jgi:hypothetical protein
VGISQQSWSELTASAGRDSIHPPLFYYLLKLWMAAFGDSLFWIRLLPALFSVIAIVPTVLLARSLGLRPVEINGTLGLAAVHPFLIFYSQHARMYSLLMLCALMSLWLFHRAVKEGGRYLPLTVWNIILVYAHYYGWLVIGLECLYVILWNRSQLKRAMLSAAITFAAFSPWLYVAAKYAYAKGGLGSNLEWIQKPALRDLVWLFAELAGFSEFPQMGSQVVNLMGLLVMVTLLAAWLNRRRLDSTHFLHASGYLLFFLAGSIATAFAASVLMRSSVWGHRHMIYLAAPFLMLIVTAFCRLQARALLWPGAALGMVWAGLVLHHHVKGDDKKTPFDTLVVELLALERATTGPVRLFSVDKYLHYPIWFYLETLKAGRKTGFAARIPDADRPALAADAARIEVKSNASIGDAQGAHFWIGYSSAWQQECPPEALMTRRGCRTGPDVTVRDRFHSITIFPVWCDR